MTSKWLQLSASLFLATLASALSPNLPSVTPTIKKFSPNGWTPKPTSNPSLELFRKRQDIPELCGFIEGDENYPVGCDESSTCLYDSEKSWFGCCTGTVLESCNLKTACVQSASEEENNSFVTYCTDIFAPYCLLYQSIVDSATYSHFECDVIQTTLEILSMPTDETTLVIETTDDFFFSDESTSSTRHRSNLFLTTSGDGESTTVVDSTSQSNSNEETTTSGGSRSTGASTTTGTAVSFSLAAPVTSSSTTGAAAAVRTAEAVVGAVGGVLGVLAML